MSTTTHPIPDGTLRLRPVDPDRDAALLHDWVTEERAVFWGMREKSLEEVREIYAWIDEQDHLTARLACLDDEPWALFQTYDPAVDEIGQHYARRPGDIGVHLLLRKGPRPEGLTARLLAHLLGKLFAGPAYERVVLEPDLRNRASVALLARMGATPGPVVELPEKTAQFAFLDRATWQAGLSAG